MFRSAPPQGRRGLLLKKATSWANGFDPRPREEGDQFGAALIVGLVVSIRAPAQGATALSEIFGDGPSVSIRAPAQGATAVRLRLGRVGQRFDPRPRAGGDESLRKEVIAELVSIRAPAQGATC